MNRQYQIQRLENEIFDVLIIGGGASGTGCALDAALRGLRTAMIEREDFSAGTSSKSTKLIHGGVRYLEQAFKNLDFAQLRQVRHGLEERHIVLKNAPHLAKPLGLITPVRSWIEGLYFSIGLKIYGWFAAGKDTLPPSRWLNKEEAMKRMPGLTRRIHSAVLYYDGQLDDARYCVALAQSACAAGAAIANHTEVKKFTKGSDGRLHSALVHDRLTGRTLTIRAHCFLNCTGPYADHVRLLANPALSPRIRPSKGVHIMLPWSVLGSRDAMLIPKTKDGRVVFAVPFESQLMVGTTDSEYTHLEAEPVVEGAEVDFLLETLAPFVSTIPRRSDLSAGFGGLRPLIAAEAGKNTKNLVRDHEVEYDPASGLFSLLGGKWTTYRLMASDAIDAICEARGTAAACTTADHLLWGAQGYSTHLWENLHRETGLDPDICAHLAEKYGDKAIQPAKMALQNEKWKQRIVPGYPFILAEAAYCASEEMACTLRDFMARRLRLEIESWAAAREAVVQVAEVMGEILHWSAADQQTQVAAYKDLLETFKANTRNVV